MIAIRNYIAGLAVVAVTLWGAPCLSKPPAMFEGVWQGGGRATEAKYGNIRISSDRIFFSFDRKKWKCRTAFEIVAEGSIPAEGELKHLLPTNTGRYVKVKVGPSKCTDATYWVFTFSEDSPDYLGLVEFGPDQWLGTGHFLRTPTQR